MTKSYKNNPKFKDSHISATNGAENTTTDKQPNDISNITEKYKIDPKLLNEPIIQYPASEIVSSPFWHPCKFCGHPIVFIHRKPYDVGDYKERHRCSGTRQQWLDHLNKVEL